MTTHVESSAGAVLVCRDLGKTFVLADGTELDAVDAVDLSLPPGSATAVMGRNGTGKSTLLRLIAGITAPTTGSVRRPARTTSLIELSAGFDPELTGWENMALGLALAGLDRRQARARQDAVVALADIGDALDTPIKRYSDGMRARLSVAVAVHSEPELLLIDEVLAVGDTAFQRAAVAEVTRLVDHGTALLLVTHDPGLARATCTQALWMEAGRIVDRGDCNAVIGAYLSTLDGPYSTTGDPQARVESVTVSPQQLAPGDALTVTAAVSRTPGAGPVRCRVDIRPPIGYDWWMRHPEEAIELREVTVIAVTPESPELPDDVATVRSRIGSVPITPPGIEATMVLLDADGKILDELGVHVPIPGEPVVHKLDLLVTTEVLSQPSSA